MRFKRTILAVSVLAAMGSVSGAEINLQETIKNQNGFDNLSSAFDAVPIEYNARHLAEMVVSDALSYARRS